MAIGINLKEESPTETAVGKKGEVREVSKEKRIAQLQAKMEKDFGEGTLIGGREKSKHYDIISTGSLGLDKALGIGGLPRGRIVEMIGWESSGKTTLAIHIMAEAHKNPDSWCAFVDVEHAFDSSYAEKLGVDLNRLKINQPSNAEEALEIADRLCSSGDFDVVVLDSVAALVTKAELERTMGESSMGKQSMLMSQAMRKLTPIVSNSNTLMIFINQMREKIGVMFGSPETTPGGNALKFYSSVRLDIRRYIGEKTGAIVEGDERVGNLTKVKVIKNKTSPPFRECEFNIRYGEGIDNYGEILKLAVDSDVIIKTGNTYTYKGEKLAIGRDNTVQVLRERPEMYNEIKEKVKESYTPKEFEPTKDEI